MVISSSNLQEQTREVLEKYKLPILKSEVGNRTAFMKSLLLSGNILDDDSGKAKEEIENLAQEILNLISKV
jgi:cellulose biosynthesis protein BcsQ